MTPDQARGFLEGLSPSSVRLGLDRIRAALAALGNPERDFPSVHVAGTNGKGSTCAFLASMLAAAGLRVGLYTSPHLERFHERIRVSGADGLAPIDDQKLAERITDVLARAPDAATTLSYFEFGTLLAFWHFARERVDLAIVETGLGGRLDATTCCESVVTAITPVALDHQEFLGDSLGAIAAEKAGILKEGVPVVIAAQAEEARAAIRHAARALSVEVLEEGADFSFTLEPNGGGLYRGPTSLAPPTEIAEPPTGGLGARSLGGLELGLRGATSLAGLELGLRGAHQHQNAAVALACLEVLSRRGIQISEAAIRTGLRDARWPGRLELVARDPLVLLDGAHNPHGIRALVAALETDFSDRPWHVVFGVLGDKDVFSMIRQLFPRCQSVTLVAPPSSRALAPALYRAEAEQLCAEVSIASDPTDALQAARRRAGNSGLVVGCGSLVLVGALRGSVLEPTRRS